MKKKIDKSCQTPNTFFEDENNLLKLYHLRPRRKSIKYKRSSRPAKRVKSSRNLKLQIRKNQNSSSSFYLQQEGSNSNRSSIIIQSLESSKSSNILSSDEESSNIRRNENKISTSSTLVKKSRRKLKFERPQTCPASLCLKIIDKKSENSDKNKELMNSVRNQEENNRQRAGISLSDVVLRKQKFAHQSISDKGLKLRFSRKRSIRTTLKDVLSSPKRKRRLIENSKQNSRDEEDYNFIDLCSRSLEMSNDGFRQEKQKEIIHDKNIEKISEDNNFEVKMMRDKVNEDSFNLNKSPLKIDEDKKYARNLESTSSFQDRELIFDRKLNLMAKYFKDAINALQESIIVKQERESGDFKLSGCTLNTGENKLDKGEGFESFGIMEEIVDVGTNDDAKKNGNLLEKISMLRGDVTILLEDAGKNDKTLEFFRNSRNFSRSSNDETRKGSVNRENSDGKSVGNTILAQNLAECLAQTVAQNRPQSDQTVTQNTSQIVTQDVAEVVPQNSSQTVPQTLTQNASSNMTQNVTEAIPQNRPHYSYETVAPPTASKLLTQIIPQSLPQNRPEFSFQNKTQSSPQLVPHNSPRIEPQNLLKNISRNALKIEAINLPQNLHECPTKILTHNITQNADKNLMDSREERQSKFENKSTIDKDDVQILRVITNNDRSTFFQNETNYLDGDYHFLLSLYQQLTKMPEGRKLKMRLKMQQLFYEEICTIDSD